MAQMVIPANNDANPLAMSTQYSKSQYHCATYFSFAFNVAMSKVGLMGFWRTPVRPRDE